MTRLRTQLPVLLATALVVAGCGSFAGPQEAERTEESLTLIVTQLRVHLREDPYRHDRQRTRDGRNAFHVALWKLDRLARERALPPERWENVDFVIEFGRARALERLRRYPEAAAAYRRVAASGSMLTEPAERAAGVMERFAAAAAPLETESADALGERARSWRELAFELRHTPYGPLASVELEAWEMLEVDRLAREESLERAIEAQRLLIERHVHSKRFPAHLIQLGDLYAASARRESLLARARPLAFDRERYERLLDLAFSAYEQASDSRVPAHRTEAETRIEALLSHHTEVSAHVR